MKRNYSLVARWLIIFTVMTLFSFQSLIVLGLVSPDKALAQSIHKEAEFKEDKVFLVKSDHEDKSDLFENKKMVCTLNQQQLDSVKSQYSVSIKNVNHDKRTTKLAVIKGNKHTTRSDIYSSIGLTNKDCKIIKQSVIFTVFLLPGVS